VDRIKTRISIPRAQPGGRALVLKTAGLAIERRVAPRDRRNGKAIYKPLPHRILDQLKRRPPDFTVKFTEDKEGFYINHRKFAPDDEPMIRIKVGTRAHWRVTNATDEIHPFHIHQVHFLVYERAGVALRSPEWMDTVNIAPNESLDLIMDFTDPIIRGVSVFHCHLLKHEDKGMMAKILFQ
jgi:suppressor of ftsI